MSLLEKNEQKLEKLEQVVKKEVKSFLEQNRKDVQEALKTTNAPTTNLKNYNDDRREIYFNKNLFSFSTFLKVLLFLLVQPILFITILYASTKIPFIGKLVQFHFNTIAEISNYTEISELNQILEDKLQKMQRLESINNELKSNLNSIQTDHPELFDQEEEPRNNQKWKLILGGTVLAIASLIAIKYLAFGSSGAAAAFSGAVQIIRENESANRDRVEGIINSIKQNTQMCLESVEVSEDLSRQVTTLVQAISAIVSTQVDVDLDLGSMNEPTENERSFSLEQRRPLTFIDSDVGDDDETSRFSGPINSGSPTKSESQFSNGSETYDA